MNTHFDLGTLTLGFALVSPENGLRLLPQSVHHILKTAQEFGLITVLLQQSTNGLNNIWWLPRVCLQLACVEVWILRISENSNRWKEAASLITASNQAPCNIISC